MRREVVVGCAAAEDASTCLSDGVRWSGWSYPSMAALALHAACALAPSTALGFAGSSLAAAAARSAAELLSPRSPLLYPATVRVLHASLGEA